jgi:hypothetical protein
MQKSILALLLVGLGLAACQKRGQVDLSGAAARDSALAADSLDSARPSAYSFARTLTDAKGQTLDYEIFPLEDRVEIVFGKERLNLQGTQVGRQIVYRDAHHSYIVQQHNVELLRDGQPIFSFDEPANENEAVNQKGEKLFMSFGTMDDRGIFIFKQDTLFLQNSMMASGVGYHDDHYEFSSWHGTTELRKDGELIFQEKLKPE